MSDNFSDFGKSFQVKVISSILSDKDFLKQISDILHPNYFDNESLQFIFETIQKYFIEYKTLPTLDVFKAKLTEVKDDVLKAAIVDTLKDIWRNLNSTDLEYIKNEVTDFCKNQRLKEAILKSVDLLKEKKYENIRKEMDDALKVGNDRAEIYDYKNDIEERYTDNLRKTIESPWPCLNSVLDGGFGQKELYVVMALSGNGKSTLCMNIGAHCFKRGLRVLHYTFELEHIYTGLRYDSVITDIPTQELKHNKEQVKKVLDSYPGELIIQWYPQKSASILTLKAHTDKLILQDKKPDLVIVDYADLMKGTEKRTEKRIELGDIYSELRGYAQEYGFPVITPTQTSRSAKDDDIITAESVSESYDKIMTADFVMSLSRKLNDKIAGTGRVHIAKNRFGASGITFPSRLTMSTGKIEMFDADSEHGRNASSDMNDDNHTKNYLKKKYDELKPSNSNNNFDW